MSGGSTIIHFFTSWYGSMMNQVVFYIYFSDAAYMTVKITLIY
jgi:hypothetical protein